MPIHTPITIDYNNPEDRLKRRTASIGGTETPALFQKVVEEDPIPSEDNGEFLYTDQSDRPVSPYSSPYQLALLKLGYYKPKFNNESLRQIMGKNVESGISAYIERQYNLTLVKPAAYYMHPTISRMGAQIDLMCHVCTNEETNEFDNIGIEIKLVADTEAWKWVNEIGEMVVPLHIQIQCQHQMSVLGTPFHYIAVCFGINNVEMIPVMRDDDIINMIEEAINDFWKHIDSGAIPEPREEEDRALLAQLYSNIEPDANVRDLRDNSEIVADLIAMRIAQEEEVNAKARKEEISQRIKDFMLRENFTHAMLPDDKILKLIVTAGTENRSGSVRISVSNAPKKSAKKKTK